ncbi:MAG: hypothetical protein ACRDPH_10310 [Marmoricola sp.]
MDDDERSEVNTVLRKAGLLLLGFCVVVALGTWLVVHALGLSDPGTSPPADAKPVQTLPSSALPQPSQQPTPHQATSHHDAKASHRAHHRHHAKAKRHGIRLHASPVSVQPMQRINLTGRYPGHDNVALQVQRKEGGAWGDFPTQASVEMGTFQTYVMSGHSGLNLFRVYDPGANRASNAVQVRIR